MAGERILFCDEIENVITLLNKALNSEQGDLCVETIRKKISDLTDKSNSVREGLNICSGMADVLHKQYNTNETQEILKLIRDKYNELGFDFYDKEANISTPRW